MYSAEATNKDVCRLCRDSSSRCHSRYATVSVTRLLLLLMICVTATAVRPSQTSVMAADDVVAWPLSVSTDNDASLSTLADRSTEETLHHGHWLASLPRRDDSTGRARHGDVVSPALIAASREITGRRAASLPRPEVVNNAERPTATTTTATVGLDSPAAVNMTPVIRTARGRGDRLRRIQIRSTFVHRRSSLRAVATSFHQPSYSYLLTSATSPSLIMEGSAATGDKQFVYSLQANSTHHNTDNTATAPVADGVNTFSGISGDVAGLERNGGLVVRRPRRQSGVQSFDDVDQRVSQSDSEGLLDAMTTTSISITSTGTPTTRPRTSQSAAVPLGASALRYRARGNFAALIDPLHSGRASGTGRSASRNKWRQLATVGDNSTSVSPVTEQLSLTSTASSSSANISTDYDSVEINVLRVDINDSAGVTISLSIAKQELNNSTSPLNRSETLNSTLAPSSEWNCSKASKSLGLHAAVKLRMSDSAAALCVYTLSLLFTLVAVWPVISTVFSLCIHNQCSSHFTHQHIVFGLVAMAAVTRALYYLTAEYQLFAAVSTSGGRRAIYECWFPLIVAAFCVHQRLLYGKTLTRESTSADKGQHIKCIGLRRDLCAISLLLCSYLTLVVFLCLLIEFRVVPLEALVVLRLIFALFAVLLSAANIHAVAASSGRHIASQVVLRALFVICAGFSVVDAATLLSDDISLLLQQNANAVDVIALKAADRLSELLISVVLCSSSSLTFSRNHKSVNGEHKEVIGTKIDKKKDVKYRQSSKISAKSSAVRQSWLDRLLGTLRKSKVVDVGAAPSQMSLGIVHAVGWTSTEDPTNVDGLSPLPPPSRMTRSRSMLYNDHGFIRFRQEGDTDGESDARTLDDDEGGPGHARSVPASEYASAESLSFHRGPGTPSWSRPGSPSLAGFRAPSIHLQASIDRALDRCDIWRVGREQGGLSVEELRRIVQLYADVSDCRRGNHDHQRRTIGAASINYAEV